MKAKIQIIGIAAITLILVGGSLLTKGGDTFQGKMLRSPQKEQSSERLVKKTVSKMDISQKENVSKVEIAQENEAETEAVTDSGLIFTTKSSGNAIHDNFLDFFYWGKNQNNAVSLKINLQFPAGDIELDCPLTYFHDQNGFSVSCEDNYGDSNSVGSLNLRWSPESQEIQGTFDNSMGISHNFNPYLNWDMEIYPL